MRNDFVHFNYCKLYSNRTLRYGRGVSLCIGIYKRNSNVLFLLCVLQVAAKGVCMTIFDFGIIFLMGVVCGMILCGWDKDAKR